MALIGMDADAIRATANQIDAQSHVLSSIVSAVDQLAGQLQSIWSGHDADEFHGWWTSQHRPALVAVETAVAGLASSARNNAADQDTTSGAIAADSGALASGAAVGAIAASAVKTGLVTTAAPVTTQPLSIADARAGYDAWYASGHVPASVANERGECTSWAVYRTAQLQHPLPATLHGNGGDLARNLGGTASTPPVVGGIASEVHGEYGHVMVVENVAGTPGHYSLTVSEMNYLGGNEHVAGSGEQELSTTSTLVQQGDGSWIKTTPGYHGQAYGLVQFANT